MAQNTKRKNMLNLQMLESLHAYDELILYKKNKSILLFNQFLSNKFLTSKYDFSA